MIPPHAAVNPKVKPEWNLPLGVMEGIVAYNCRTHGFPHPVLAMPFWEGAGRRTMDYSGGGNHGSLSAAGLSWERDGIRGDGVDSNNGIVSLGQVLDITTHISIVVGIIPGVDSDPQNNGGRIISKTNGSTADHWALLARSNGGINFRIGATNDNSNGTIPLQEFSVVAGVYDGSNRKWYLRGVLDTTVSTSGAIPTGTNVGFFRNPGTVAGRQYAGDTVVCYVFDVALSAEQIKFINDDPYFMFRIPEGMYASAGGAAHPRCRVFCGPFMGPFGGVIS